MLILRRFWDMIDRLKLLWKSLTGEINTLKAICKLICTAIGYISSFFSLAVLLKDLAAWDKLEVWMKGHWQIIMIAGLLISCVHNRKKINYKKWYLIVICKSQLVLRTFSQIEAQIVM